MTGQETSLLRTARESGWLEEDPWKLYEHLRTHRPVTQDLQQPSNVFSKSLQLHIKQNPCLKYMDLKQKINKRSLDPYSIWREIEPLVNGHISTVLPTCLTVIHALQSHTGSTQTALL
jgi:hypothetical protein